MKGALILACLSIGICLAISGASIYLGFGLLAIAILIRIGIAILNSRAKFITPYIKYLHFLWGGILFGGIGIVTAGYHLPRPQLPVNDATYEMRGIIEDRKTTTKGERYTINVKEIGHDRDCSNLKGFVYADALNAFNIGDEIEFRGNVRKLKEASAFGPQITIFPERDGKIAVTAHREDIFSISSRIRDDIRIVIENSSLSNEGRGLIKGLVVADRGEIGENRLSSFRDSGMSHVLAVSGLHTGIIASILMWLTLPLGLIAGRNTRYLIVVAAVWIFAFLTGMAFSTMRAAMMLTAATLARVMERQREGFSCVCIAAIIILIISPQALTDVGFQLSFTCVASICLFVEQLNPVQHHIHPKTHSVCSAILTTIVATGATWMISGYYFSGVPTNFLITNILVLPLLPAYMIVAIVHIVLSAIGFEWHLLADLLNFATSLLYQFTSIFGGTSVELSVSLLAVTIWMAGIALLATSLNINPGKTHSGAVISQSATVVSRPWLYAALLTLAAAILVLMHT